MFRFYLNIRTIAKIEAKIKKKMGIKMSSYKFNLTKVLNYNLDYFYFFLIVEA